MARIEFKVRGCCSLPVSQSVSSALWLCHWLPC
uniref:Uncharacterized protein n=1 Tax=Anguilla anguilla TaxID=7936 RepID=A0A0E9VHS6_ANGAN